MGSSAAGTLSMSWYGRSSARCTERMSPCSSAARIRDDDTVSRLTSPLPSSAARKDGFAATRSKTRTSMPYCSPKLCSVSAVPFA